MNLNGLENKSTSEYRFHKRHLDLVEPLGESGKPTCGGGPAFPIRQRKATVWMAGLADEPCVCSTRCGTIYYKYPERSARMLTVVRSTRSLVLCTSASMRAEEARRRHRLAYGVHAFGMNEACSTQYGTASISSLLGYPANASFAKFREREKGTDQRLTDRLLMLAILGASLSRVCQKVVVDRFGARLAAWVVAL
jgi:hypothetical protein